MKSSTQYSVQQHDGLKWHTVEEHSGEAMALGVYRDLVIAWSDRPHRVLERPSRRVVVLHDPRTQLSP